MNDLLRTRFFGPLLRTISLSMNEINTEIMESPMSINERKLPVLALSACSIPVMLAFAGYTTRTVGMQSPAVVGDIAVDLARDQRSDHPINSSFNTTTNSTANPTTGAKAVCNSGVTDHSVSALSTDSARSALSDTSWICGAPDGNHFWVASGKDSTIATYRIVEASDSAGSESFELVATLEAFGVSGEVADKTTEIANGWVDLQLSEDGQWLYQLFENTGAMAVYEVNGSRLAFVELLTA